ncbi:MAG: pilus assembly protein PilM [Planctomycetales bacterium]|nr:pilus assembly protein PilM [Planctomycetales bacterium]
MRTTPLQIQNAARLSRQIDQVAARLQSDPYDAEQIRELAELAQLLSGMTQQLCSAIEALSAPSVVVDPTSDSETPQADPISPSPASSPAHNPVATGEPAADHDPLLSEEIFDPFEAWLGIHERRRPLTPYELLGVPLFEDNATKLEAGLTRQVHKLERVKATADRELWVKVSDELKAAHETLTSRERREEVDAAIRRRQAMERGCGENAAANAPDATIRCGCGQVNTGQRVYCTQCGQSLWRRCGQCNSERAIDEQHCGKCGANVREAEARLIAECRARVDHALELAQNHEYEKAQLALRRVLLLEDPRLNGEIERAQSMRAGLFRQAEEALQARAERLSLAQQEHREGNLPAALQALEEIPANLRNQACNDLLDVVSRTLNELRSAEQRIRDLVKSKQVMELAGPIEQVLAIQPHHQQIGKLAEQVRDQLCQAAEKKLAANDLAGAEQLLSAVPQPAVNARTEQLRESLRDRSGLQQYLGSATVVSGNHVAAARRLLKMTQSDEARHLLTEAENAWNAAKQKPLASWRTPPKRSAMGCDVKWQFYPRTNVEESIRQTFALQPSVWFTAFGLALQGVGLSRRSIDFKPEKKSSFGGLLRRGKQHDAVWGVDIGTHSIKALKLARQGDSVTVQAAEVVERPFAQSDVALLELLGELRDKHDWKSTPVCIAFSTRHATVRTAPLPPLEGKKLEPVLQREAATMFPMDVAGLEWRCDVERKSEREQFGVFVATKKASIESQLALWDTLEIAPVVVTVDALAARNGWCWQSDLDPRGGHALLDIGASGAVFSLEHDGRLWVRLLGISGAQMTDCFTGRLNVTREQAELLKRDFSSIEQLRAVFDDLQVVTRRGQQDVYRLLESIRKEFDDVACDSLTCIGGAALTTGLIDSFRLG